jgi:hypothetical protein
MLADSHNFRFQSLHGLQKLGQTVASTSMVSQFHEFLSLFFGEILLFGPTVGGVASAHMFISHALPSRDVIIHHTVMGTVAILTCHLG